jgi:hypothetical protein
MPLGFQQFRSAEPSLTAGPCFTRAPCRQLRRLAATTAATPVTHAAPTSNGELPNGCSSGATDRAVPAAGGKQGEQSLEAHLWPCLELCFTSHFR